MFIKKLIAICIASILALSLVSCGNSDKKSSPAPAATASKSAKSAKANNDTEDRDIAASPPKVAPSNTASSDDATSVLASSIPEQDDNPEASSDQNPDSEPDAVVDIAELEDNITSSITEFDQSRMSVEEMIGVAAGLENQDEIKRWCRQFIASKDSINAASETLINYINNLPANKQNEYAKRSKSATLINSLVTKFGNVADSAIYGDIQSFQQNIGNFQEDFFDASDEWLNII